MKVHVSNFWSDKKMQKEFKKSCSGRKWFVYASHGVWFFDTEEEAQLERKKLKDHGAFSTVHHVLDIVWG